MAWVDLPQESIDALKLEHGSIFRVEIDNSYAYFRAITRTEASVMGILQGVLSGEQEDLLLKTALVYPNVEDIDIDSMSAGMPTSICGKILSISGLTGAAVLSQRFNDMKNNKTIFHTISATICAAFPSVNPYDLDTIPLTNLLELLMIAEESLMIKMLVATGQFGEIDFEPLSGDEPITDEQKDARVRAMLGEIGAEAPAGWIDRTKRIPPGATLSNPPDTAL